MVLAGQFRRACAVGLLSAAMASAGMLAVSRARADNGDDARAAAVGAAAYGAGNCVQVTDVYGRLVTQCY